jgi:hypothetical protein
VTEWASMRDRITHLGMDYPDKRMAWSLGSLIRETWIKEHGDLPRKQLDTKTCGTGSHCFAIYPEEFWPRIDAIIKLALRGPQGMLPFIDPSSQS